MTDSEPNPPNFTLDQMPLSQRIDEVPVVFVDGVQGLAVYNDVARLNFYQLVQDLNGLDKPPHRVIALRLAMSPATLAQFVQWLNENVKLQTTVQETSVGKGS